MFIYPISPLATAWPCIRLTLAPGVCNICACVCVCVKYSAPLPHLRHNFRGVRALLGRLRRILTGVANCFVKEIGRLASTHPAGVLCLLPSVKPALLPIRPLDPDSFFQNEFPTLSAIPLGVSRVGWQMGQTQSCPKRPPHPIKYTHTYMHTHVNTHTHKYIQI